MTTDNLPDKKEYSTSNFTAMNNAIDVEVDKRTELSKLYSSQRFMNRSMMILIISSTLAVICLTITIIYWMLFRDLPKPVTLNQDKQTSISLREISKSNPEEKNKIDTSFTVFLRSQIETGEFVVTGKNYLPDNLIDPVEQYCYLESQEAETSLAGETIASITDGKISIETEDNFLIEMAMPYCQFKIDRS